MGWHTLVGSPKQYAGTVSATTTNVTIGAGEILLFVSAWTGQASGKLVIFGGPNITIPQSTAAAPIGIWNWWIEHTLFRSDGTNNLIAVTNVDHYFFHTVKQGNA